MKDDSVYLKHVLRCIARIEEYTAAFNFLRQPRLFAKQGPLDQSFGLEPFQFVATVT